MIRTSTYPARPSTTKQKGASRAGARSVGALAAALTLGACGDSAPTPLLEEVHIDTFVESCQRAADGIAADLLESGELTGDWSDLRLLSVDFAEQPVGSAEVLYLSKNSVGVDGEHVNYNDLQLLVTIDSIGGVRSRDRGILIHLPGYDWEAFKASVDQLADFPLPMSDYLARAQDAMVLEAGVARDAEPELRRLKFQYFTRPQHLEIELGLGDLAHVTRLLPDGSPAPPE